MAKKETTKETAPKKETPKAEKPAKKTPKIQYWQHRVHIPEVGTVQGEVNPIHLKKFKTIIPKETDIKKWVGDKDPIQQAKEDRKKLAKARRTGEVTE